MSNPLLRIQRAQLVDIIGDDPAAIRAFEELFKQTDVEGGVVGEAPQDDTPYSRENAGWVSAPEKADVETLTNNSMVDTLHRHSELSASDGSPDAVVNVDSDGILYVDAAPKGLDVLYSAEIGTHLTVGNNLIIGGTVDGIDIATDVGANNAKVTNATHTSEVTGSTSLIITDNIVDEANLKLDTGPTNDHVLTADSGKSGGMKWAAPGAGSVFPPGMMAEFGNISAPSGWLACDGASVLRATYPDLFTAIGVVWGSVDGTHFNVPDRRGTFARGTGSHGSETMADGNPFAGPAVGTFEDDQVQGHHHRGGGLVIARAAGGTNITTMDQSTDTSRDNALFATTDATYGAVRAGDETRSFAAGVLICIKT